MNRVYFKIIKTSNVAKSSQISIHTDGVSRTLKWHCLPAIYTVYYTVTATLINILNSF